MEMDKWAVVGDGMFRQVGATVDKLEPGAYEFVYADGIVIHRVKQVTDSLLELPDDTNAEVLKGMRKFWDSEARYRKHNILYKRGVLLHGPPGSGKSATIALLSQRLIADGGFVVFYGDYSMTSAGLQLLRKTHPKASIVCVIEDIDDVIDDEGDRAILALLDGERQVDGVVWLATTNYLEKLPATLINRPSRFDEVRLVGMPSAAARRAYLHHIAPEFGPSSLARWTEDTEGFSLAYLKELFVAVICLEHEYDTALGRLRTMANVKPSEAAAPAGMPVAKANPFITGANVVLTAMAPEVTVGV